jgi:hypothetical protein
MKLEEFTTEELERELERRRQGSSRLNHKPVVHKDGTFHMEDPNFCGSVSWCDHINWAMIATDCEFVIDTKPSFFWDKDDPSPRIWKRTVVDGECEVELVGTMSDPKALARLMFEPLGYSEPEQIVEWDIWLAPEGTDFRKWAGSLPISAEPYIKNFPCHEAAMAAFTIGGDGYQFIRKSSERDKIWADIQAAREKGESLYSDW